MTLLFTPYFVAAAPWAGARCRYHILHWELLHAGAHEVVDEEDQLGRRMAAQVRQLVGRPDDEMD